MNSQQFQHLLEQVPDFTNKQSSLLSHALPSKTPVEQIIYGIEQRVINNPECPHCCNQKIIRHGKTNNT